MLACWGGVCRGQPGLLQLLPQLNPSAPSWPGTERDRTWVQGSGRPLCRFHVCRLGSRSESAWADLPWMHKWRPCGPNSLSAWSPDPKGLLGPPCAGTGPLPLQGVRAERLLLASSSHPNRLNFPERTVFFLGKKIMLCPCSETTEGSLKVMIWL